MLRQVVRSVISEEAVEVPLSEAEKRDIIKTSKKMRVRGYAYKPLDDLPTLVDYIAWCHVQNFQFTWLCVGDFGSGKSTLLAWLLYYFYGWGRQDGWDEAMKYMVYNIEDIDELRDEAAKRGRLPLIVVDDAGLQLFSREFNSPMQRMFMRSYQTIREYANTVIFALNTPEEIDVSIRKKVNGVITVISPLDMLKYMDSDENHRRLHERFGNSYRIAWFCTLSRRPDREDPTRSFRYYTPIHGPHRPFIFTPLPREVEEKFRKKKIMATRRVDYMRSVIMVKNPKHFSILNRTLTSLDKKLLKSLCFLFAEKKAPLTILEISKAVGLTQKQTEEVLLSLYSTQPALAIEAEPGAWKPTVAGIAFNQQLQEVEGEGAVAVPKALAEEEEDEF
jgi:hypothetical protein